MFKSIGGTGRTANRDIPTAPVYPIPVVPGASSAPVPIQPAVPITAPTQAQAQAPAPAAPAKRNALFRQEYQIVKIVLQQGSRIVYLNDPTLLDAALAQMDPATDYTYLSVYSLHETYLPGGRPTKESLIGYIQAWKTLLQFTGVQDGPIMVTITLGHNCVIARLPMNYATLSRLAAALPDKPFYFNICRQSTYLAHLMPSDIARYVDVIRPVAPVGLKFRTSPQTPMGAAQ